MKTNTTKLIIGLALTAALPATAQDAMVITAAAMPESSSNNTSTTASAATSNSVEASEMPQEAVIKRLKELTTAVGGRSAAGRAAVASEPAFGKTVNWTYMNGGDMAVRRTLAANGPETFLGVSVSAVSPEISTHLSLQANTGLLVDLVEKDSPAEKAGLENGDILAKLDDQILILPQQLSVLVSGKKEGETVKISFLRKGQLQEISATLVKKAADNSVSSNTAAGTIRIGDADLVIDGSEGRPIRTFMRRLEAAPAESTAAAKLVEDGVLEKLEKIQAALDALNKAAGE